MSNKQYSAGMVKLSFWFPEFRQVVGLLNEGKSWQQIKALNIEENIFAAPTNARAIQIFNTVSTRVKAIDPTLYEQFDTNDIATQKLINLIAIMNSDDLFFEFVYEVFREKLIIGSSELADSDLRIFFHNKQLQSEKVAGWRDYTLKRLGACYKTMLLEAGLIDRSSDNNELVKPILDVRLERCLIDNGMELILHALTGVR